MSDNDKKDANTRDQLQKIAHMIDEELPAGWGFWYSRFRLMRRTGD